MLVRLLIAVLVLAGPMPVRFCTCAAAARPPAPADRTHPSAGAPAPEAKGCGCRAKSNAATATDAGQCGNLSATDAGGDHSHPGQQRHDRDCPAVNPAPVVAAAAPTPADHGPAAYDLCPSSPVETVGGPNTGVGSRPERRDIFRSVPLYISLLTLRN